MSETNGGPVGEGKSVTLTVRNELGLHARAAVKFVQTASRFSSEVWVGKTGEERVNGKSIMGLLTLVAAHGSKIDLVVEGQDAEVALAALKALVEDGFGEGIVEASS